MGLSCALQSNERMPLTIHIRFGLLMACVTCAADTHKVCERAEHYQCVDCRYICAECAGGSADFELYKLVPEPAAACQLPKQKFAKE